MTTKNKRIYLDIKEIKTDKTLQNIYYHHDEDNINKGYAFIYGNPGTPYGYGYYLFEFTFPENYPFSPPNVKFITGDGITRFHPNLYVDGKICLSILNTWPGEKWSSCQSILTILINLSVILDNNPLLYEPSVNMNHPDIENYNEIIYYRNIEKNILYYLNEKNIPHNFLWAKNHFSTLFMENFNNILNVINDKNMQHKHKNKNKQISLYKKLGCIINYVKLKGDILKIKEDIVKFKET